MGFPGGSVVKNPPAVQVTWVGKIPWSRKWQPTPVFLPGNSMDRGAWQTMGLYCGAVKSQTQLSD